MKFNRKNFKSQQFFGLSLGGGKGTKTCLSLLEYFPSENKLFLSELFLNIRQNQSSSADSQLVELINKNKKNLKMVGVDVPLTLPACTNCRLKCPGHESCEVPQVKWMWNRYIKKGKSKKRPNKIFTPYTERCIEQYIQGEIDVDLASDHAMGANRAPLAARGRYLEKRLQKIKLKEVNARVSFYRLAKELGLRKSMQKGYRQLAKGDEARLRFLEKLSALDICFFYHRDFQAMVKDLNAFESFLVAFTGFLSQQGLCEKMPKTFPAKKEWVLFPAEKALN